jgi:TP53 regulating kinase-like protein
MKTTLKQISSGAEAVIYLEGNTIIKHRIRKFYRIPELDKRIIKQRTKSEKNILTRVNQIINAPKPEASKEEDKIIMQYIIGDKLSEKLDTYSKNQQEKIMLAIGKTIGKLHKANIIHGDLTTSNIILKGNKIFLIDFGLGFQNGKYEDKGVDIHLLKQALEAKHFKHWESLFKQFEMGYRIIQPEEAEKVFERMKSIEKRGRYRH